MKYYFAFLTILISAGSFAQDFSQYESIPLTTAAEYRKAEPHVILATELVLATPIEKKNKNRENAIAFIMKWMGGTSDFSFIPDKTVTKVTANDPDLVGVYFACLAKYALEKGKGVDREELRINAYTLLAKYCENPDNNYKLRGEMKKLVDAKNQNKIKEYLDSKQK